MRLLFWQEEHPTVRGGAESWLRDTAAALRARGHDVSWLQSNQIRLAVNNLKPDVVIMGTLHCFVGLEHVTWLAYQRTPAIWMLHDYWPFCSPRMLLRDHNRLSQGCEAVEGVCKNSCGGQVDLAALVNRFYAVTGCEGAATILRRNGINVRAVVEEGIDTDLFRPSGDERDATVVYASAAGDDAWKGIDVLRYTELPVRFLTGLSRAELAATLGRAAVYAFPSVYQEIWGLTLTEAMACSCAVVASDVAGARAQVEDGVTGLLVPAGDPAALADALRRLLADAALRARLGAAAREHVVAGHNLRALGERWEAVCMSVAGVTR